MCAINVEIVINIFVFDSCQSSHVHVHTCCRSMWSWGKKWFAHPVFIGLQNQTELSSFKIINTYMKSQILFVRWVWFKCSIVWLLCLPLSTKLTPVAKLSVKFKYKSANHMVSHLFSWLIWLTLKPSLSQGMC